MAGEKYDRRLICLLNRELKERVKNAVYWLRGPPHDMTLAAFCATALERYVTEIEAKNNKGKPFPRRKHEKLTPGRPEGS